MAVSTPHAHERAKAMTVSHERFPMPVGGGGAWPDNEPTHEPHISDQAPPVWRVPEGSAAVPVGGGGAWPGFETTRRAKLAARTASGRAGHAAAGPDGARNTIGAASAAPKSELLVVLRVLVGLAAAGAPERADRRHLFRRQREGEDVEVLALALRVTGLGQGQGTELVVPAQDEA